MIPVMILTYKSFYVVKLIACLDDVKRTMALDKPYHKTFRKLINYKCNQHDQQAYQHHSPFRNSVKKVDECYNEVS